jgi:hypothetical protein
LSEEKISKNTLLAKILEKENYKKRKKDIIIDKKNIKKFVEKWEKGMTTNEISSELQNENLNLKIGKKKRYNLKK